MNIYQKEIRLKPYKRGFHLITETIEDSFPELGGIKIGVLNVFIKHTSASLTINENADSTVRSDFEAHMNILVPEDAPYYV
ncbi:MAG: YjbQ family protein, partial [Eudoraea sp.]